MLQYKSYPTTPVSL